MTTCLAMLSGGLDSLLAIKLMQEQNIKVIAIHFENPFSNSKENWPKLVSEQLKVKLVKVKLKQDYLNLIKKPKHGYGSHINPCIDCKIFMFKKAKSLMKKYKASFIITGEVLNQRPMSQHLQALKLIEKESKLKDLLLRPLSAKLLEITIPEKKNLVNRAKLLNISGRSRKRQLALTKKYKINKFSSPAGGCLLTDENYAIKLKDLFKNNELNIRNVELLKYGRHFRINQSKVIVGRNYEENKILERLKGKDVLLEPFDIPGPSVLVLGKEVNIASKILVYYTKVKEAKVKIKNKIIKVKAISEEELNKYK